MIAAFGRFILGLLVCAMPWLAVLSLFVGNLFAPGLVALLFFLGFMLAWVFGVARMWRRGVAGFAWRWLMPPAMLASPVSIVVALVLLAAVATALFSEVSDAEGARDLIAEMIGADLASLGRPVAAWSFSVADDSGHVVLIDASPAQIKARLSANPDTGEGEQVSGIDVRSLPCMDGGMDSHPDAISSIPMLSRHCDAAEQDRQAVIRNYDDHANSRDGYVYVSPMARGAMAYWVDY